MMKGRKNVNSGALKMAEISTIQFSFNKIGPRRVTDGFTFHSLNFLGIKKIKKSLNAKIAIIFWNQYFPYLEKTWSERSYFSVCHAPLFDEIYLDAKDVRLKAKKLKFWLPKSLGQNLEFRNPRIPPIQVFTKNGEKKV
jgi:hypothetical protein